MSTTHYGFQSHDNYPYVLTNSGYYMNPESAVTLLQRDKIIELTSKTTINAAAIQSSGSNYITFDMDGFEGDYLEEILIKLPVTNNSLVVGNTTLVPAPLLIQRAEIYYDSQLLETVLGEAIWVDALAYNDDEVLSRMSMVNGYDYNTFLTNNTFADSESKTFYIPLRSIITGAKVPFCCEASNKFRIRIYLRGGVNLIETGFPVTALITDFTVGEMTLIMIAKMLDPRIREKKIQQLMTRPCDYRFLEHRYFTIQSGSVTAGVEYNENIQQMGDLSHMFLFLRPAGGGVGEEIYSPLAMDQLDFIDSSGLSLLATSRNTVTSDLLKYIMTPHYFPSRMFDELDIYPLTWNVAPTMSIETQAKYGGLYLNSDQRLVYIPTATTANTEILVLTQFFSLLTIDHYTGQIDFKQSV